MEEHFYLLLVVLLAWLGRRRPLTARQAVAWFCAVALTVLAVRTATVLWLLRHTKHFSDAQDWFFQTHLRIDALLFGVLLAYLYHHRPDLWERCATQGTRILVCSLLLLVPAFIFEHDSPFTSSVGLTLYYVAFGGILVFVLTRPGPTPLWASIAAPVGVYSYSIYVWHGAVKHWAAPAVQSVTGMHPGYLASTLRYFGGSLMVGIGMAKLIEFPILRLRDRYVPSPLSTRTQGSPSTSLIPDAGAQGASYGESADRAVGAHSR